jgi:predicted nucleic acid binding AN1-type Zn finger protein
VNRCVFPNCSVYVELIGHTCIFCKQRFCLNHCLAEKHGCRDEARRKAFADNGKAKPMKANDRAKLKVLLHEKIQSEEKNRAAKVQQKTKPSKN